MSVLTAEIDGDDILLTIQVPMMLHWSTIEKSNWPEVRESMLRTIQDCYDFALSEYVEKTIENWRATREQE